MQTLWQDLRYGARMLFKNPAVTLVAVIAGLPSGKPNHSRLTPLRAGKMPALPGLRYE